MIALLLTAAAHALGCADPFTAEEFVQLVEEADDALDHDDVMAHGQTWVRMKESLPCMEEPVPAEAWARYLIGYAILRHATGENWRAPLITALGIDPDIARDYGHEDIRQFPVPPDEGYRGLPLAPGERFLLDGKPLNTAPPRLDGPHILQLAGERYVTRLVIDREFPSDWLAPPETFAPPAASEPAPVEPEVDERSEKTPRERSSTKRSPVLLVAGGTLAAGGTAMALGSYFAATRDDANYQSPGPWNTLTGLNVAGWAGAAAGAGLITVHVVSGPRVSAGPGRVSVSGRF
ncbi:MAG: hypothetical protein EP330_18595 [Deltaproteobacteria bacterium]|nr:MAG: hypothetical protein EP330_18595 [Deltaproteobacteria bacterium]